MTSDIGLGVILCVCAGIAVASLTGPFRSWLIRKQIYDQPNARSSHAALKPRGGGVVVVAVVLLLWPSAALLSGAGFSVEEALVAGAAIFLASVSFVDDLRGLSAGLRLVAQVVAVGCGVAALEGGALFQGLVPGWLDLGLTAVLWLWFVNLFNFMDGIDGITGVETITIALGLSLLVPLAPGVGAGYPLSWLLAGAGAGFLWWNWAPARVFLGDVGSVTLGFLLGWLLVEAATAGQWAVALILPAYYLVDATLTLVRRMIRRERIWQAHREHAYQRAVQRGASHAAVAGRIAGLNALLGILAFMASVGASGLTVAAVGSAACLALLLWMKLGGRASHAP